MIPPFWSLPIPVLLMGRTSSTMDDRREYPGYFFWKKPVQIYTIHDIFCPSHFCSPNTFLLMGGSSTDTNKETSAQFQPNLFTVLYQRLHFMAWDP